MSQRYSFLEQFDRFMQKTKPVTCFFYRAYKFPNARRMHSSKLLTPFAYRVCPDFTKLLHTLFVILQAF